jgi:hypothetical protein
LKIRINEGCLEGEPGWNPFYNGGECRAVRFTGGNKAELSHRCNKAKGPGSRQALCSVGAAQLWPQISGGEI